nr:hypothetical protein CFP56_24083 [Quercus suber]
MVTPVPPPILGFEMLCFIVVSSGPEGWYFTNFARSRNLCIRVRMQLYSRLNVFSSCTPSSKTRRNDKRGHDSVLELQPIRSSISLKGHDHLSDDWLYDRMPRRCRHWNTPCRNNVNC